MSGQQCHWQALPGTQGPAPAEKWWLGWYQQGIGQQVLRMRWFCIPTLACKALGSRFLRRKEQRKKLQLKFHHLSVSTLLSSSPFTLFIHSPILKVLDSPPSICSFFRTLALLNYIRPILPSIWSIPEIQVLPKNSISLQKFVSKLWYFMVKSDCRPWGLTTKLYLTSLTPIPDDCILCVSSAVLDFSCVCDILSRSIISVTVGFSDPAYVKSITYSPTKHFIIMWFIILWTLPCLWISEEGKQKNSFCFLWTPCYFIYIFHATLDLYSLPEDSQFPQSPFTEILLKYFLTIITIVILCSLPNSFFPDSFLKGPELYNTLWIRTDADKHNNFIILCSSLIKY